MTGYADIILGTDDAVYVWEVKSRGGNTKIKGKSIGFRRRSSEVKRSGTCVGRRERVIVEA